MAHLLRIKKELVTETGGRRYICRYEVDKASFQHDMAYNFKDMKRRIYADKVLKNKAFKIASDPNYDGYQTGLAL